MSGLFKSRSKSPKADRQQSLVINEEAKNITDDELEELQFTTNQEQDTHAHSSGEEDCELTREKLRTEKRQTQIKTGDYTVQVHIIEARDLRGKDMRGTSDPVVTVKIMDQKMSTTIKKLAATVKWDEVLYFEFKNINASQLQNAKCSLLVYDADMLSRNDLIGSFELDLVWIYFKDGHEIFKQWIALSDVEDETSNVPGYLKVSIVVLGPGDEQKINIEEEYDEGLILTSPEIEQFPFMMKIKIYLARNLPVMDESLLDQMMKVHKVKNTIPDTTSGCDPFIWVEFAGQRLRSKVFNDTRNPRFLSQFEIPVMEPVFTKLILITVMDHDEITRNDRIAVLRFDYQELKSKYGGHMPAKWYPMYGATRGTRKVAREMNKGAVEGVVYRGELLVEIVVEKLEKRGQMRLVDINPIAPLPEVKTDDYEFLLHLYQGCEVKTLDVGTTRIQRKLTLANERIFIMFSIGELFLTSVTKEVERDGNGSVAFYQQVCSSETSRNTLGPIKLCASVEDDACPDLFVYVCLFRDTFSSNNTLAAKQALKVSYIRIPIVQIVNEKWAGVPRWYDLKANECLVKQKKQNEFPGSLLIAINGGRSTELDQAPVDVEFNEDAGVEQFSFPEVFGTLNSSSSDDAKDDHKQSILSTIAGQQSVIDKKSMEEQMKTLSTHNIADITVRVLYARNLPIMDILTKRSDPYVVLEIEDRDRHKLKFKTKIKKKTLQPTWREVFVLKNIGIGTHLKVKLYDWDSYLVSEYMGFVDIPMIGKETLNAGMPYDVIFSEEVVDQYKKKRLPHSQIWLAFQYSFYEETSSGSESPTTGGSKKKRKRPKIKEQESKNRGLSFFNLLSASKKNTEIVEEEKLSKPDEYPMQLRCHIYRARHIRNADRGGLSDPYFTVRFMGKRDETVVIKDSLDPEWYCTLFSQYTVAVPLPLTYAPRIYCELMDEDLFQDDLLGKFSVYAPDVWKKFESEEQSAALPDPVWYDLYDGNGETVDGEVLACFQLIGSAQMAYPLPDLSNIPTTLKWIHIISLGLRDLSTLLGVYKPYIKFELNGNFHKTTISNDPSAHNPNYLQILKFSVRIPVDSKFWPNLNLTVRDSLFGGIVKRTLGFASIELEDLISEDEDTKRNLFYTKSEIAIRNIRLDKREKLRVDMTDKERKLEDDLTEEMANMNERLFDEEEKYGEPTVVFSDFKNIKLAPAQSSRYLNTYQTEDVNYSSDEVPLLNNKEEVKVSKEDILTFEFNSRNDKSMYDLSEILPEYMDNRLSYDDELEDTMDLRPFIQIPIFTGKYKRTIGYFKGLVKFRDRKEDTIDFDRSALRNPTKLLVRIYILKGRNLVPRDTNGTSDPYLKIKCGKEKFSSRSRYFSNIAPNDVCEFYEAVEMPCTIPGTAKVSIEVWDWDGIGDDLIGKTEIDIEDRWFTHEWRTKFVKKPVEHRTLWVPTSTTSQGKLTLWVEILSITDAKLSPMIDIKPPEPDAYQLRLIVWKCEDCPIMDETTNMNDLYITAHFDGGRETKKYKKHKTDLHFRSLFGNGSFNWRMIWPVLLPMKSYPRLIISVWDKDFFSTNDSITQISLDIASFFKYGGKYGKEQRVQFFLDGKKKFWVKDDNCKGKVLLSLEIMPDDVAELFPAGMGRDEPNANPYLPEPVGRKHFSILNPWDSIKNLLGSRLILKICCIILCALVIVLFVVAFPSFISASVANIIFQ